MRKLLFLPKGATTFSIPRAQLNQKTGGRLRDSLEGRTKTKGRDRAGSSMETALPQ